MIEVLRAEGTQTVELQGRWLTVDGEMCLLTPRQVELMRFFMEHPDISYSGPQIVMELYDGLMTVDNVRTHLKNIRRSCPAPVPIWSHLAGNIHGYIFTVDPKRVSVLRLTGFSRTGRRKYNNDR